MGFYRILKKIIKWILIAFATLFSTVVIFVVVMFLNLVGIVEFNIKNKTSFYEKNLPLEKLKNLLYNIYIR